MPPVTYTDKARSDSGTTICAHTFRNPELSCEAEATHGDYCLNHARLEKPDNKLGTCAHKFVSGPRTGLYCTNIRNEDGLCVMHAVITEPNGPHCSHVWTRGDKTGGFCMNEPYQKDLCYNHYMSTVGLNQPEEGDQPTCAHKFDQGLRVGLFCPRSAGENGRCTVHMNVRQEVKKVKKVTTVVSAQAPHQHHVSSAPDDSLPTKPAPKPKAPRKYPPLAHPMRCTGHVIASQHLCHNQARSKGLCLHHRDRVDAAPRANSTKCKAMVVKYRMCKLPAVMGCYCHMHYTKNEREYQASL